MLCHGMVICSSQKDQQVLGKLPRVLLLKGKQLLSVSAPKLLDLCFQIMHAQSHMLACIISMLQST